jgi:hypothetical protein
MQRQRAEGDEKRPGDIPGDAQHEITVSFRENPGAHGGFTFVAGRASCGTFNFTNSAVLRQFDTTRRITAAEHSWRIVKRL